MSEVTVGADGLARRRWGASPLEYLQYHDGEWGRPVSDETRVYEKLCLEGFQSGLSWLTILRKRDAFRKALPCRRGGSRGDAPGDRGSPPSGCGR